MIRVFRFTGMESVSEEMMSESKKSCADCKTTKTPLWRSGPVGPKSLCNACGIRYRKKRNEKEKKKEKPATDTSNSGGGGSGKVGNLSEDLRVRLVALGKEVVMLQKRQRSPMKRQRTSRKLGEEEQAAVLLMALSCGSVFA
ncbi:GATA transcription factor 16 [Actinidia rufa]|uniref:GATA transcription factor 16 n=1 Tax=Actinidia rufa TaxID=165716 RepID=A0A7J0EVX9_9ERIC|nr:GATA transcription factor 16 [Actinidia rufa]